MDGLSMHNERNHDRSERSGCSVAFTPAVRQFQAENGSRHSYARLESRGGFPTALTGEVAAMLATIDTFFLATASAAGQPYVQHRGGPRGLLKVLDQHTLGFADFRGNRQYISGGNISENPRVILLAMDFEMPARIKFWGRAHILPPDHPLAPRIIEATYDAQVERLIVVDVEAWDVNCSQHIRPRRIED